MIDLESALKGAYPKFFASYPRFFTGAFVSLFKKLFYQDRLNEFIAKNSHLEGVSFANAVLEHFNFRYHVDNEDLQNIPESGKVVFISNHPLGALDSLSLISLIGSVRPDVKILANELLFKIEPLKNTLLPIDNVTNKSAKESVKLIMQSLKNEEAIIIFPAGEVSRIRPSGIKDVKWKEGFLRFAKKAQAPILPLYIHGRNSWLFYAISMIYKPLAALLLAYEMFNKRDKSIRIKVGEMIPYENLILPEIKAKNELNLLKKHLYAIGKGKKGVFNTQKCLIRAQDRLEVEKELHRSLRLGKTRDSKSIYLADCKSETPLLREIGRLRELSFRKVGEGTGKRLDIDSFDFHYRHLVLWDEKEREIVGAYRVGESDYLKTLPKKERFYTETLFDYQEGSGYLFDQSIELGRSFVQPKFWGTRALDYLWFGIGAYLREYPNTRYLFGPVSLSASYPRVAREMIIFFYKRYFGCPRGLVLSKNRYLLTRQEESEYEAMFSGGSYEEDFKILKENLSHFNLSIPTLYKQYSELCEEGGVKFFDFGVDPEFENCIDGFIVIEVSKIKESKKKRYIYGESAPEEAKA